jgi:FkbM family methyltransferase
MADHPLLRILLGYVAGRLRTTAISWRDLAGEFGNVMREMPRADREKVARVALHLHHQALNSCYSHAINGEFWLIDRLAPQIRVAVDVGANEGIWSGRLNRANPAAAIHAFEPVPNTFDALTARLGGVTNVVLNRRGLSDRVGDVALNVYAQSSRIASIYEDYRYKAARIACPMTTGDIYVRERGIAAIDLLKIDCEGAERAVIAGFAETLRRQAVNVVQIEYGPQNIFARWLLADIYDVFAAHGFRIGRLFPEYVDFKKYHVNDETFIGGNYVACRADRGDLIALLGG